MKRPPKKWFDEKVREVKRRDKRIEEPEAVVGHIWHNVLSEKKKREIVRRERVEVK